MATQCQNLTEKEIQALNKRLKWQLKNLDRGIKYIALNLDHMKIFVFINGSFTNNKDFSSQIGYLIILANETANGNINETANEIINETTNGIDKFTIKGNLIHYNSTKNKRVTRSVLASKIYGMVGGINMAIAINTIIRMITS